jgi:hypothetical protein
VTGGDRGEDGAEKGTDGTDEPAGPDLEGAGATADDPSVGLPSASATVNDSASTTSSHVPPSTLRSSKRSRSSAMRSSPWTLGLLVRSRCTSKRNAGSPGWARRTPPARAWIPLKNASASEQPAGAFHWIRTAAPIPGEPARAAATMSTNDIAAVGATTEFV